MEWRLNKMLKKIGLPLIALLALLVFVNPTPAKAGVHFGVAIGGAYPVPVAPVVPYAGYAAPYYGAPYPAYGYAAPVYPYGGVSIGYYGGVGYRGYYAPRYGYGRGYYGGGRYVGGYHGYRR